MRLPPVYILHGWAIDPTNEQKWQALRERLVQLGIATRFLALPGLSSELTVAWNLGDYVEWLDKQLVRHKQVILIGHSFGGQLAVRYTALHTEKVARLVLVASAGLRDHSFFSVLKRKLFLYAAKLGKRVTQLEAARAVLYFLARERDYYTAPTVMKQTLAAVITDEVTADLPTIACPVQLIWGGQDRVTPVSFATVFKTLLPHARLHVIPSARHSPQFTHPAEVATCIAEFLAEYTDSK